MKYHTQTHGPLVRRLREAAEQRYPEHKVKILDLDAAIIWRLYEHNHRADCNEQRDNWTVEDIIDHIS